MKNKTAMNSMSTKQQIQKKKTSADRVELQTQSDEREQRHKRLRKMELFRLLS